MSTHNLPEGEILRCIRKDRDRHCQWCVITYKPNGDCVYFYFDRGQLILDDRVGGVGDMKYFRLATPREKRRIAPMLDVAMVARRLLGLEL